MTGSRKRFHCSEKLKGQLFVGAIVRANSGFIQTAVIVGPEALEETHHETVILWGSISELMPSPMVLAHRDEDVLIDVERVWSAVG